MADYDVLVIGAGPGGYVAAIRAAQLGLKTACVDDYVDAKGKPAPGGTCLNVGCIPSKALLDSSHHFHDLAHSFAAHGINTTGASIDVPAMIARKAAVVQQLNKGVSGLFRKNKIDAISGRASLLGKGKVLVTGGTPKGGKKAEARTLSATHIIVATGSRPVELSVAPVDGAHIVDNTGALAFDAVPERLGVIGAGVIGLELGSVWSRLGSKAVLLEALPDFLSTADRDISRAALKSFKKQGLDIRLGAKVTRAKSGSDGVTVTYEDAKGEQVIEFDKLIVAVGRRANTEGLDTQAAGLALDAGGRIEVDAGCRTGVDGIYAIGDVVRGPMLAHKASEEGVAVAEEIAGQHAHVDHATIPWVIYTHPEVAWVGKTEAELQSDGVEYRSGSFPFMAIGRAIGSGNTEGMVKMLGDARTDRILGIHVFGANASEVIAEAVTAMAFSGSTEDLARTVHAHPTMAEAMHEAALAVDGRAIHI